MAPLDELHSRRGEPPYGGHCPIPAPHHDPVAEFGHAQQGIHIFGGGVKDIEEVGQGGLFFHEIPEDLDGQSAVCLRQLQQIDVPSEQTLHHAVGRQTVHVTRGDVQQHP